MHNFKTLKVMKTKLVTHELSDDKLSCHHTFSILHPISLHSPSIKYKFVIYSPWK